MTPSSYRSRKKYSLKLMCMLRVDVFPFLVKSMLALLSMNISIGELTSRCNSSATCFNQTAVLAPIVPAMNSASSVDNATHFCFVDAQATTFWPFLTTVPDVDLPLSTYVNPRHNRYHSTFHHLNSTEPT
jgi:hypothetical protein